jgi:nicotinamide mononucleotide transporter
MVLSWLSDNWIEIFGAITGIIYVFLEIRQNPWLWPIGIITSAVYIWIFFMGKLYADMSLQVYYLAISITGWYWWVKGAGDEEENGRMGEWESERVSKNSPLEVGKGDVKLKVTHLKFKTGMILAIVFVFLYFALCLILSRFTDSPVPEADSFITSLSIVATWMLARKIYEHWYLWIVVNTASSILFFSRGLFPTVFLYIIYLIMSFIGLRAWKYFLNEPASD